MTHNFVGVFGHVNIDYIMHVPELPRPNTSVQVSNVKRHFGGTGANIAMLASSMGVNVALASFVGEDFPQDYEESLSRAGVDIKDVVKINGRSTPTCKILSDAKGNQMCIMDQGAMLGMREYPPAMHTIETCDVLHIGTGHPAYYRKVMLLARKLGKRIHFDPAQELRYMYKPETFSKLLGMSDMLFVNQHELKVAMRFLGLRKPEKILDMVPVLVLTKGKAGSEVRTPSGKYLIRAIKPKRVVDPTGAGDAYRAGFYAGLSRGYDLETCGMLGSAASSFAIEAEGPLGKLPTWEEVRERARL